MTDQQAFGLNRMDLLQREGKYNLPPQASKTILGVEFAGIVTETGEGASKYKVGDEVFGLAFGVSCRLWWVVELTDRARMPSTLSAPRLCFSPSLRSCRGSRLRPCLRTG